MKLRNHEYRSGMKQGEKDAVFSRALAACPYRMWPMHNLEKYKAWVAGWYKTFTKGK